MFLLFLCLVCSLLLLSWVSIELFCFISLRLTRFYRLVHVFKIDVTELRSTSSPLTFGPLVFVDTLRQSTTGFFITSIKPKMDFAVYSPLFRNVVTTTLNSILCSIFSATLGTLPVLYKLEYRTRFICANELHRSQLQSAVTLLCEVRFM